MTRADHIREQLAALEQRGIVRDLYTHGGDGLKWVFVPRGFAERSLTTSQIEDFIMGAHAALNAAHDDRRAA